MRRVTVELFKYDELPRNIQIIACQHQSTRFRNSTEEVNYRPAFLEFQQMVELFGFVFPDRQRFVWRIKGNLSHDGAAFHAEWDVRNLNTEKLSKLATLSHPAWKTVAGTFIKILNHLNSNGIRFAKAKVVTSPSNFKAAIRYVELTDIEDRIDTPEIAKYAPVFKNAFLAFITEMNTLLYEQMADVYHATTSFGTIERNFRERNYYFMKDGTAWLWDYNVQTN
jgi:hypothetical protein